MSQRSIRSIIEHQELVTSSGGSTVAEAARLMREKAVGAVMVLEEGKLAGVFTERDALFRVVAESRDAQATRLSEVMTRDPQTVHPDRAFTDALHIMHEGAFRHVPVVEDGRPIAMISARDALGPELEDFIYELLRQEQAQDVLSG
ncbi:MAG: CBS domain-containing protein [Betaproteobacteria bacterium]|nr:CBS domain-containing protein [Betaproteobacteria bacterium]MDH3437825.1 CBS domain-containing protein [Betaproteobacteria bacterium]